MSVGKFFEGQNSGKKSHCNFYKFKDKYKLCTEKPEQKENKKK